MRYIIGMFSCADKTEGVLCAETGQVLRLFRGDYSPEAMLKELLGGMPEREVAAWIGMPGRIEEERLLAMLPEKGKGLSTSFAEALLRTYRETGEDGAAMYMHMTACVAAQKDGKSICIGGNMVPPFSAGGSYQVGHLAIQAALAAARKTGKATCLSHMLERAIGMPLPEGEELLETAGPEKVASLSRLVRRGVRAGDEVSIEIARYTIDALLGYLSEVAKIFTDRVPLYVQDVPAEDRPTIKAAIESRFGETFSVIFSAVPPLYGAVRGAAGMLGILPDKGFADLFRETYSILSASYMQNNFGDGEK